jgi:ABC-type Zn2+ transport system substrate-binding protein/surface adhesin
MKTIFTLLSSLVLSAAVLAAPADRGTRQKSTLTIKSSDNADIRVVLDGRRFEPGYSSVMITGLESGYHTVKVYRQKNNGIFNIVGKRYEMVYSTSLQVRPRTDVQINIDRFGRTSIQEQKSRGNRDHGRDDRDHGRDDRDRNNDWDNDHSYDYDHDGKLGDYDQHYGYERGMEDREFRTVLQSIEKEWLETNKLKSATQIVRSNSLTSAQVKQLVLMFSFESNKLELAKQAYQNTVDKKNYYIVNDAFSFNSSKDELARFIRR